MCTRSESASAYVPSGGGGGSVVYQIYPNELRKKLEEYVIIDVREANEPLDTVPIPNAQRIPLGCLVRDAMDGSLNRFRDKKIVCYCNVGYRSHIATTELRKFGFEAFTLHGGSEGWKRPAGINPTFLSRINDSTNVEPMTQALSIALAALANGDHVGVILFGSAVRLALKPNCKGAGPEGGAGGLHLGAPFKPVKVLLETFLEQGGYLFACKSCVVGYKLEYSDFIDGTHQIQAPDVARMFKYTQGTFN